MKRTILYLIVFLISINFTVAQENTWKYKDRTDFIVECVKAASEGMSTDSAKYYCYCMLSEIEEKYPNPADAAKLTPETFNSPEWKVIVRACLGSYWTSYQRNDFMTSCI